MNVVGIWKTWELTVRLHKADCSMVNTTKSNKRLNGVHLVDADGIEDLKERGYKIVACKCTRS